MIRFLYIAGLFIKIGSRELYHTVYQTQYFLVSKKVKIEKFRVTAVVFAGGDIWIGFYEYSQDL